nr:single-stranded DNA-bindnig protein WHY2, mitochondrial [Tanacetum cinerariifolium]
RRGSIMLTFRPAIGERKYDSEKKQLFALSVMEVGSFISMGPGDTREFFHDPAIQSSAAGQVRKSLSIKPIADGYFISLSVANNILKTNERFTVPVTTAEFAVMREAFSRLEPNDPKCVLWFVRLRCLEVVGPDVMMLHVGFQISNVPTVNLCTKSLLPFCMSFGIYEL